MLKYIGAISLLFLVSCKTTQQQKKWVNPEQSKIPIDVVYEFKSLENKLQLLATNKRIIPIEFELSYKVNNNNSWYILIQPNESKALYTFNTDDRQVALSQFKSKINYRYFIGDKDKVNPDQGYLYGLPYAVDKSYKVVQSFGGKSSHSDKSSFHAIDFDMTYGEPVHAARGGLVVIAIDWFNEGGKRRELTKKSNKVVILHDDGTLGSYAHLDYKKVFVKEGQMVARGELLAEAGNTGYSGGAHLHFVVRGKRGASIPIYFKGYEKIILKRRQKYFHK